MVLIISNSRIQSRRHSKIQNLFRFVDRQQKPKIVKKKNLSKFTMSGTTFVLAKFFLFSAAMFTFPFAAFFGTQHLMYTWSYTEKFFVNCVSVLAAVLVVNIIIGLYAYSALHEADESKGPEELEDSLPLSERAKKFT